MRVELLRMRLGILENNDTILSQYFQSLKSLVTCLSELHPSYFTRAQEIQDMLSEVSEHTVS